MNTAHNYCPEYLRARAKAYEAQAVAYDLEAEAAAIYGGNECGNHGRGLAANYRLMAASSLREAAEEEKYQRTQGGFA